MYNVSAKYSELIAKPVRYTGIYGIVTLANGTIVEISDSNIKQGSLSISDKLNRNGEFKPGGVYSSQLSVELQGFGDEARSMNGAVLQLEFRLYHSFGASEYESVPLGVYYVDGSTIKRKFESVKFKADDCLKLLDVPITEPRTGGLFQLAAAACTNCGIELITTQEEFEALPNGNLTAAVNISRVQTERDLMMYIAMCTNSFISADRETGGVKFVQLKCTKNEGGVIQPVREIALRYDTEFSDEAAYVARVYTRKNGVLMKSSKKYEEQNNRKSIYLELSDNPLLSQLDDDALSNALDAILIPLGDCLNRAYKATFPGDPALEVGDYIRLTGGAIDTKRGYATGMITQQTWRYGGSHEIRCNMPASISSTASGTATYSAEDISGQESVERVQPKSQLEKRIDSIEKNMGNQHYLMSLNDSAKLYHINYKSTHERNRITIDRTDGDTNVIILERFIENSTGYLSLTSKGKKVNNEYKYGNYFEIKSEDEKTSVALIGGDLGLMSEITSTGDITLYSGTYSGTASIKRPRLELLADGTMFIIANGKRYKVVVQEV